MKTFDDFKLIKPLRKAITSLGFNHPTPIQQKAFSVILSGKDMVGIAQTGTGKTLAYLLPVLNTYQYSKEAHPTIVVVVPTRELVLQVVDTLDELTASMSARVKGVYGGVNMNTQAEGLVDGVDVLVATPRRLYDLVLARAVQLKRVKKLVIDEVDVLLDLGFRPQLINLFDLLPDRRQNILFSATMTEEVDAIIDQFFIQPKKIAIAVSGTPLDNIRQTGYAVQNFYTKVNLLSHLLADKEVYKKVLVFISNKKHADLVYDLIEPDFGSQTCIVHSNKSQNYRERSVRQFDEGEKRILVTTDIMARGLDLEHVSHVISMDTPAYPENYIHRIGRTGRAEQEGTSVLFYTAQEEDDKLEIELLMNREIPELDFPEAVVLSSQLLPEERPKMKEVIIGRKRKKAEEGGASFHEKKDKNKKVNLGSGLKRRMEAKYKKPKTRGDKNFGKSRKNKRR